MVLDERPFSDMKPGVIAKHDYTDVVGRATQDATSEEARTEDARAEERLFLLTIQ